MDQDEVRSAHRRSRTARIGVALCTVVLLTVAVVWVSSFGGDYLARHRGTNHFSATSFRGQFMVAWGELWSLNNPPSQGWRRERTTKVFDTWPPTGTVMGFGYKRVTIEKPGYRWDGREVYFPLWPPLLASGILTAINARSAIRRTRLSRSGLCPTCGYDLRASPDRCPECGARPAHLADAHAVTGADPHARTGDADSRPGSVTFVHR